MHVSPTSSLSSMLQTSAIWSSYQTINVTRSSIKAFSSEERHSGTGVTFSSSLAATVTGTFIGRTSSAHFDSTAFTSSERSAFPQSISTSLLRSFSHTPQSFLSSGLLSTSSRLATDSSPTDSITYFSSPTTEARNFSSSSFMPLLSRSDVYQNATTETRSISRGTLASSQTGMLSSPSLSLLKTREVTFLSQATSVVTSQSSFLLALPTSYISRPSVSSVIASLNRSSAFVATETQNIIQTTGSVALNSSMLTSVQGRSTSTKMTPKQSLSSERITGSLSPISNLSSTVLLLTPVLSSVLPIVTSTASGVLSGSLFLNSSLVTQSTVVGNKSSMLAASSKHAVSSSPVIYPDHTTSSLQSFFLPKSTSLVGDYSTIITSRHTGINQTFLPSRTSGFDVSKTPVSVLTSARDTLSSGVASQMSALILSSTPVTMVQFTTFIVSQSKTSLSTPSASHSTHHLSQSIIIGPSQSTSSRALFTPSVSTVESSPSVEGNNTVHNTSLHMLSTSSIPSLYPSEFHSSTMKTDVSRPTAKYSIIGETSASITSRVSRTRFSDVLTPNVSHAFSLTTSKSIELSFAISSVKMSSLPVVNVSTTRDVSLILVSSFVLTTPVTPMTTTIVASNMSSQFSTAGLTAVATKIGFSSPSVPPSFSSFLKRSSGTISSVTSVASTSTRTVSSRAPMLSSLQASSSFSTVQTLTTTQLTTPDFSVPSVTLTSPTLPKVTSVTVFNRSKSVTPFSSATAVGSSVSLADSMTYSSVGPMSSSAVPSAFSTFVASQKSAVVPSTLSSETETVIETTSRTVSRQISLPSSAEFSHKTYQFISTKTVELSPFSLVMATTSIKSSIVTSRSLVTPSLASKSGYILTHSTSSVLLVSSEANALSSTKVISTASRSIKSVSKKMSFTITTMLSSAESTGIAKSTFASTSSSSRSVKLGSSSIILSKSSLDTLSLPSTTVVTEESSSLRERSPDYSTVRTSKESPSSSVLLPVTSLHPSSSLVHARSSSLPFPPSSLKPAVTTTSATAIVTSGKPSRSTLAMKTSIMLSIIDYSETSKAITISTTVPLSTVKLPLSTAKDVTTASTPESSSLVSKTSPTIATVTPVEPTEPVRPTANANNTEGLVGIQILVPTTENEVNSSFREEIELRLAAAYRWGLEKGNGRKKRDLEWLDMKPLGTAPVNLNARDFELWKGSATFKVYEKRGRRFRREADNIVALVCKIIYDSFG